MAPQQSASQMSNFIKLNEVLLHYYYAEHHFAESCCAEYCSVWQKPFSTCKLWQIKICVRKGSLSISSQVLLLKIIYKCTKHYCYLQTYLHFNKTNLQASSLLKHICTDTKLLKI
jgi:hypothetical protein